MEFGSKRDQPMDKSFVEKQQKKISDSEKSDELPMAVQQEIEDLCYYVPEVTEHFNVLDKIGEGTFSSVFLASLRHPSDIEEKFALKHIIPTSHPNRIIAELRCLQLFGGRENVMGVELCLKNRDHCVIIMPYFHHHKFLEYFSTFDVSDVRHYMRNLMIALRHIHRLDIIHRDIKPNNFLHNVETKKYALVDFGLAQDAPVKLHAENQNKPPVISFHKSLKKEDSSEESQKEGSNQGDKKSSTQTPLSAMSQSKLTSPREQSSQEGAKSQDKMARMKLTEEKKTHVMKEGQHARCMCYGRPSICSVCTQRPVEMAHRAGTPGFRAPEVLMKNPNQTTAVDIWSAGVILLSLLSGRYPFFRANDDMTSLAQIISLLGTEEVKKAALTFGKLITAKPVVRPQELKSMCERLRASPAADTLSSDARKVARNVSPPQPVKQWAEVPDSAVQLLKCMLDPNPATRITADEALHLDFLLEG